MRFSLNGCIEKVLLSIEEISWGKALDRDGRIDDIEGIEDCHVGPHKVFLYVLNELVVESDIVTLNKGLEGIEEVC